MKKLITVLLTAMLFIANSAYAENDFNDYFDAYMKKQYEKELILIKPQALSGDHIAQNKLGIAYENGRAVTQDYTEALKWYKLAAEQGDADAQHNIGNMYRKVYGVKQDYSEAARWYKLAAEQGHAIAQYDLSFLYLFGQGVERDLIKAHMWYNLSANAIPTNIIGVKFIRNALADQMTQQQIEEAQKLARECLARKYKGC